MIIIAIVVSLVVPPLWLWGFTQANGTQLSPLSKANTPGITDKPPAEIVSPKLPDLIVESLQAISSGCGGGSNGTITCTANLLASVKNIGLVATGSSHTMIIVEPINETGNQTSQSLHPYTPALAAGQSTFLNVTFSGLEIGVTLGML